MSKGGKFENIELVGCRPMVEEGVKHPGKVVNGELSHLLGENELLCDEG